MSEGNYNLEMARGAKYGELEVVKNMLEKGANDYKWAIKLAASYGHIEIVKLLLEKEINSEINRGINYREIMLIAVENGQIEIVKLMCKLGADNYEASYMIAVENGYLDIAQMMSERCQNDVRTMSERCIDGDKPNILTRRSSF